MLKTDQFGQLKTYPMASQPFECCIPKSDLIGTGKHDRPYPSFTFEKAGKLCDKFAGLFTQPMPLPENARL
jgi:hypothetical protein